MKSWMTTHWVVIQGLQPLPNPPITHCFQVPTTLPYDKRTYQDRDGASSPEEDERSLSTNGDSTLIESRAQLEFDDDDTWNEPEEESCCPAEESPSERALKRKVAFSKGVKTSRVAVHMQLEIGKKPHRHASWYQSCFQRSSLTFSSGNSGAGSGTTERAQWRRSR